MEYHPRSGAPRRDAARGVHEAAGDLHQWPRIRSARTGMGMVFWPRAPAFSQRSANEAFLCVFASWRENLFFRAGGDSRDAFLLKTISRKAGETQRRPGHRRNATA